MNASRKIGFIGTGIMGAPMAGRLAEAGHSVRTWNRSPDKSRALADKGGGDLDHSALIRELRRRNSLPL